MDFYIRVGRNDDAYRITQQIEAMELGNFPPEATAHALGQAVPSPSPFCYNAYNAYSNASSSRISRP
jgi:hypothetical protein